MQDVFAPIRSFLFVPGDSVRKQEKSLGSGADAIILDLEDSVAQENRTKAREICATFLKAKRQAGLQYWVRINPLDTEDAALDIAALAHLAPDGIVLPKAAGPDDCLALSKALDKAEQQAGLGQGSIKILPITTETASAPFRLGAYCDADLPRLYGLSWGAEDLAAALGAATNKAVDGSLAITYKMVRSMALLAARGAGGQPVETVYTDFRDTEGFAAYCAAAYSEGFTGCFAIHPAQVPIINTGFMPNAASIAHAKNVIAAFDGVGSQGVASLDGQMLDKPHLVQAKQILAMMRIYAKK